MLTARAIPTEFADVSLLESSGEGLPLLMLHGSATRKEVFARQLQSPMGKQYRLIAMDLPGHGESGDARHPASAYTLRGLAGAVAAVIDALELRRVALFGWSLGGHIAIELLATHPAVAGLMLTGAPPVSSGPLGVLRGFHTHWDLLLASKEHFSAREAARYHHLCFGDGEPEFIDAIMRADGRLRPILFRSMMRGEGADQRSTVEASEVPIAMVNGARDPIVRLGYLPSLNYRTLWDDRCYVIAGAGHSPFLSAPDQFNSLLGRFLSDVEQFRMPERPRLVSGA